MSKSVSVPSLPLCNFGDQAHEAEYDFKTKFGPWANGCEQHYLENRAFTELGTGQGQKLIKRASA